jgi:hypothetical protein
MPRERFHPDDFTPNPTPYDDSYGGVATAPGGSVSVVHGVYAHTLPLAGMTVGQARTELQERMNIDPTAVATLDGQDADEDTVISEGQVLTFVQPAGEKGAR